MNKNILLTQVEIYIRHHERGEVEEMRNQAKGMSCGLEATGYHDKKLIDALDKYRIEADTSLLNEWLKENK